MAKRQQAKGHAAKKLVREAWCKETFQYVVAEKTHEEAYHIVDETLGTYYTFGALVKALGGLRWAPAILGAKLHFIKAGLVGRLSRKLERPSSGFKMIFQRYFKGV